MNEHRIAIWVLNESGLKTSLRLSNISGLKALFVPDSIKIANNGGTTIPYSNLKECVSLNFNKYSAHLFIMASGIVIRLIAGLIKDKSKDPAVLVADDQGRNIISLLSGHLGGANMLAIEVASVLRANPVITTATDISNIIAVDTIARETGSVIENRGMIKVVSSAMLKRAHVAMVCDPALYERFYGKADCKPDYFSDISLMNPENYSAICIISERIFFLAPAVLVKTLFIRPQCIVLGIGCNCNITENEISQTIDNALQEKGISSLSVACIATIDKKRDEQGLLNYCESTGRELIFFSADELNSVISHEMSPPSSYAQKHVNASGVAEPAALLCAGKGAKLILKKIKSGNMTIAVAQKFHDYAASQNRGRLFVLGIGPGGLDYITGHARSLIGKSSVIAGYRKYIDLIHPLTAGKEIISTGMTREIERVDKAIAAAVAGKTVSLVCSGDSGIYGLAGLVYERMEKTGICVDVEISPGVTAGIAAGSLLGAPLSNDFITISLSNLLTSDETVKKRIRIAAQSNMVTTVYNPVSRKRKELIEFLGAEFLRRRSQDTPVGIVTHALRNGQKVEIKTLGNFLEAEMDMNSVIIIGNTDTVVISGKMVTRRGYEKKEAKL